MKTFYILFLSLIAIHSNCQIKFEKGYIITNDLSRKQVLIKNQDWFKNPVEFVYKESSDAQEKKGTVQNVKEFGVDGFSKLVSYKGNIDYSSTNIASLSLNKSPEDIYKEVFLYEIVSGKTNLYSYTDKNLVKFFYSTEENRDIKPLVFKEYYFDGDTSQIAKNEEYKNTLKSLFSDNPEVLKRVDKTGYNDSDLKNIFSKYNGTEDKPEKMNSQGQLHLGVRPGASFSTFKFSSGTLGSNSVVKLPTKSSFRIGLELEYIFPFNKNKWAAIFEPTYYSYKSESVFFNNTYNGTIDYSVIEFPIGLRHYMFLNNNSKLFINAQVVPFKILGGDSKFTREYVNLNSKSEYPFEGFYHIYGVFGAGFNYKNYTIEFRTSTSVNPMNNYKYWNSRLGNMAIVFGYQIF